MGDAGGRGTQEAFSHALMEQETPDPGGGVGPPPPIHRAPSAPFSVAGSIQPAVSDPRLHLQIGQYKLSKTLGIGSFGKVKLAQQCVGCCACLLARASLAPSPPLFFSHSQLSRPFH